MYLKAKLNFDAPIIPKENIAGLSINIPKEELLTFLHTAFAYGDDDVKVELLGYTCLRVFVSNSIEIIYDILEEKIFEMLAYGDYKGKLFDTIQIGDRIEDILKIDKSFSLSSTHDNYLISVNFPGLFIPLPINFITGRITTELLQMKILKIGITLKDIS